MKNSLERSENENWKYLAGVLAVLLISCGTPKKVVFEEPVDTKSRKITDQTKKSYEFNALGLWISNEFDAARLNHAAQINDSTVMLRFDPENVPINKSPYFAFTTWSKEPKQIYFGFQYPDGFEHRYRPKKKENNRWVAIDSMDLIKKEDALFLKFQTGPEPQTIAAQEINSSEDVRQWYVANIVGKNNFVRLRSVGTSQLGRNLPVLDIYHGDPKGKPIIVLLTRQHPPEVTGYFAFQNFLKAIVAESALSRAFLSKYRVLAFQILNPDGVDLGHWRHNANGIDLNRDWAKYRQPEVRNVVSFIDKTSKKDRGKIILGLDFHSTYEDVFYTNTVREKTTLPGFIDDWFELLEKNIPDYKVNEQAANSTKPVSKGWFLYGRNATAITYEIGDHTPRDRIEEIGTKSANGMMEILLKK